MLSVDWDLIESLSRVSSYVPDLRRLNELDNTDDEFEIEEYHLIIEKLRCFMLDPIEYGLNYNQTDIKRKLRRI